MIHALEQLNAHLSHTRENRPVLDSFHRRTSQLALVIKEILHQTDPSLVYWYELSLRSVFVHGTPLEVGTICNKWLFGQTRKLVFTSATLTIADSFEFLLNSLGMPPETRELQLASPFAYEEQALLYVPKQLPLPQSPQFCDSVAKMAATILTRSRGRALFLFTSYRNLNVLHAHLRDILPYPILVQGQKPKIQLLTQFKQKIDSVLLATSSFWHGIDVPGEALSCLLIDKLPFEVPEDPLIAARIEYQAMQGRNPFYNYQVPRAIIHLKQGMGRLIRSSKDRGIIAIFDVRLFDKSYGKLFLESLPPCRITRELNDIDDFFSLPCNSRLAMPGTSTSSDSRACSVP
jgi:ATP-dependent DNA helicase DinG